MVCWGRYALSAREWHGLAVTPHTGPLCGVKHHGRATPMLHCSYYKLLNAKPEVLAYEFVWLLVWTTSGKGSCGVCTT